MSVPTHTRWSPQSGATAVETTICILLLLMVATAIIEFSYWGVVRQLCRLALHETLRIAVSEHGTQRALDEAFKLVRHSQLTEPWSLEIVHPDSRVLSDFQEPALSWQVGSPVIRNDSQREQHQRFQSKWPGGVGPASGIRIFEANILKVKLTYQHRLLSPWFRRWIGSTKTGLSLEAAMQSDFHASQTDTIRRDNRMMMHAGSQQENPQHAAAKSGQQQTLMDHTLPLFAKEHQSASDFVRHHQHVRPQHTEHPARLIHHGSETNTPLHPDLAEQCGSFMCCTSP